MIPIPEDGDPRMTPQGRFFEFINQEHWIEMFNLMGQARQANIPNDLYDACQAAMTEVGYQHWARVQIVEALEPDSSSLEDTISAIRDLRRDSTELAPAPAPATTQLASSSTQLDRSEVELAVQRVLARVEAVPSALSVAEFLELTRKIAGEIVDEPGESSIELERGSARPVGVLFNGLPQEVKSAGDIASANRVPLS